MNISPIDFVDATTHTALEGKFIVHRSCTLLLSLLIVHHWTVDNPKLSKCVSKVWYEVWYEERNMKWGKKVE